MSDEGSPNEGRTTELRSGDGSRVEAAEAGLHHEMAEILAGQVADEHVTAADMAVEPGGTVLPAAAGAHHHPPDPNAGVVVGRTGRHAVLAAGLTAAFSIAAVVLLALAVAGTH